MLDTKLVIMTHAFLGLENLYSEISYSGLRTLKTRMSFG